MLSRLINRLKTRRERKEFDALTIELDKERSMRNHPAGKGRKRND